MINADTLPSPVLDAVVRQCITQVSQLYLVDPSLANAKTVALGETFSRWVLRRAIDDAPRTGAQLFKQSGYWHQLTFDGVPGAFAHSQDGLDGSGVPSVCALGVSPLVAKIDQAITWLDTAASVDGLVRLVDIPSHYLLCFWISGVKDYVVAIHAADPALLALLPPAQVHPLSALTRAITDYRRQVPLVGP